MTKEEILSHFETKMILNLLKKEFPFIKGVSLDDTYDKYITFYFMDVLIDPNEMSEFIGSKFRKYMVGAKGELINYLKHLVSSEEDKEVMENLQERIFEVFDSVHGSGAIPPTMKLDKKPRGISFRTTSLYQS